VESNGTRLDGLFAFHGTASIEAIKAICHGNLDTRRRSGQVHGPGEYFGESASVSHTYAKGTNSQIVFFLLSGHARMRHVPGFCYVVNNPTDGTNMFCLPLCVVHYGSGKRIANWEACCTPASPMLASVEKVKSTRGTGPPACKDPAKIKLSADMCPFRFRWCADDGSFQRYADEQSRILNMAYENGGKVTLEGVPPLAGKRPHKYEVDFGTMTQRNTATGGRRRVDREMTAPLGRHWTFEFENERSAWMPYADGDQKRLNQAFSAYQQGGPAAFAMRVTGRSETYEVNFAAATQKNLNSGTCRMMRRL
jgi:hypothetical protein